MKYEPGSYTAKHFKKQFGLSSVKEKNAYSEGSTTGTKQLEGVGTYLTKEDYEKNKNSDKTWEAYAKVNGQEAADAKREGNPDGLSINAFDSLMDSLAKEGGGDEERFYDKTPEEYEYSQPIQDAKERVSKFQQDRMSGALYETHDEKDTANDAAAAQMKTSKKDAYSLTL